MKLYTDICEIKFLWECLPILEIFPDYCESVNQILTERPSCLQELEKEVVSTVTFSLAP